MKFELKGAVNYLPAITYGKMKNSYADIDFNYEIINNPYFIDADIDTSFIEKQFKM